MLATHQHEGRSRWLQHSVSEPIARQSGEMTLFIPHGVEGFVSRQDGAVSLRNILIPIAPIPRAQPAIAAAVRLVHRLQCPQDLHDAVRRRPWGRTSGALSRSAGLAVEQHREIGQRH